MYRNNILNFQESTIILNACTKKSGNLLKALCMYACIKWDKSTTQILNCHRFVVRELKQFAMKDLFY